MHITAPNEAVVVYRTSYLVKFNTVTGEESPRSAASCLAALIFPYFLFYILFFL